MKKEYVYPALIFLLAITIISVMRAQEIKDDFRQLQVANEKFVEQVSTLEMEIEKHSSSSEKLEKENNRLTEEISKLEEENETIKTSVNYQDFHEAVSTVESYKVAKTFEEAREYLLFANGLGYTKSDDGCPCEISFNGRGFKWFPNAVQELKEFSIEGDKIYLTYNTSEDIKRNYKFILAKGEYLDQLGKWRIKLITID
ncbi:hypothetical protein IMZ08_18780 [Bacillus luteolus]|uniref:Uncharacterized protein n=1 Tax=Litchfieldia luteola TaxID=682179 RepID=A0ABR9QNK3_9BACI|nr:hypothetical protein [Cytobacillus luteolus]MBE4910085.1 hypothetical protein [Cytobacillus luteolus]MBP1942351.1 cell division protein FtsB [Cytobacillus luteolus]